MEFFIKGADVSMLQQIEDCGGQFYDGGVHKDCLQILKGYGINYIRLRLWNDPPRGYCNLEKTVAMAKRIKELGFKFLLDFHYSDLWADPEKQFKPGAWKELSFEELQKAVYSYTREVMEKLHHESLLPNMVQIGNEIIHGMLWEDGKINGEFDTDAQWTKFVALVKAGIDGLKDSLKDERNVETMIHIDRGGDNASSRRFFDEIITRGIKFDVIGQSFYPFWHGTLADLEHNLTDLAARYDKEVIVVESSYPFTLEDADGHPNMVNGESRLHDGYSATVEGQAEYMRKLMSAVKGVPGGKGRGIFYWEPDWIPVKGAGVREGMGNSWENQAMFDFQGNALKSLEVFREF